MTSVCDEFSGGRSASPSTRSRWLFAIVVFAIGVVPVTAIAKAVAPSGSACPGATYTVISGDSWYRISTNAKVTMTALMNANGATTATVIHPGQTLCLPGGVTTPVTTTTVATPPALSVVPGTVKLDFFPAQGPCSFTDTYGAPRSGGRSHEGVDIIAKAGQWLYAVKDGTLTKKYLDSPGSLGGNGWRLTIADGTYFFYAHMSAFAPGLVRRFCGEGRPDHRSGRDDRRCPHPAPPLRGSSGWRSFSQPDALRQGSRRMQDLRSTAAARRHRSTDHRSGSDHGPACRTDPHCPGYNDSDSDHGVRAAGPASSRTFPIRLLPSVRDATCRRVASSAQPTCVLLERGIDRQAPRQRPASSAAAGSGCGSGRRSCRPW